MFFSISSHCAPSQDSTLEPNICFPRVTWPEKIYVDLNRISNEYFQFQTIPKIITLGPAPTKIKIFSLGILRKPWFIRNPKATIIASVKSKKYVRNKVGRSRPLVLENSSFRLIVLPPILYANICTRFISSVLYAHILSQQPPEPRDRGTHGQHRPHCFQLHQIKQFNFANSLLFHG